MRRYVNILVSVCVAAAIAACGYALPQPLQFRVDNLNRQGDNIYSAVERVKNMANEGSLDKTAADNVRKKYSELIQAHDVWLDQVHRVISKEIEYFDNDEQYNNTIAKLATAGSDFETAADAALNDPSTPTTVPDWADESRELIKQAYLERKMKKAASEIQTQLRLKRWDEIGK